MLALYIDSSVHAATNEQNKDAYFYSTLRLPRPGQVSVRGVVHTLRRMVFHRRERQELVGKNLGKLKPSLFGLLDLLEVVRPDQN